MRPHAPAGITLVIALAGCGGSEPAAPPPADVVVGSFNFAESALLAEIYAQAVEAEQLTVRRVLNLGARELVQPALQDGLLDFVPEYLGTALTFVTLGEVEVTAEMTAMQSELRAVLEPLGLTALTPAPAEDKNAVVVTADRAAELGLQAISDLAPHAAALLFGGPPECPDRPYCLPGLQRVYGLQFAEFVALDASGPRTVGALHAGDIEVAILFSTHPALGSGEFVALEDDLFLQPAENVLPVVRMSVYEDHAPALDAAAMAVAGALTTEALIDMNAAVANGARIADVAAEFIAQSAATTEP